MTPHAKPPTESDPPTKQVNIILQNLRGEQFRHARNVRGKSVSNSSLSSHAHNQPTLPINLIYPAPAPATSSSWVPGPSPPRSWRSPATSESSPSSVKNDVNVTNTPAWRGRALSPLFSAAGASPSSEGVRSHPIYPDPSPIPRLTLLCLQLIRSVCLGADLVDVASYIPRHLRRALLRYAAVHAPLSQTQLDALCQGTTDVDTELVVVGPQNTLRASLFQKNEHATNVRPGALSSSVARPNESWDAVQVQDSESLALRSLAVISSPLSVATMLAFPPTITHLALINLPRCVSLQRLPAICPLIVFLDLSYNAWLYAARVVDTGKPLLEDIEWEKWRRLEVVGLRVSLVTPKVLLELNRGRWEDVKVIQ